jgi:hypothetical protein
MTRQDECPEVAIERPAGEGSSGRTRRLRRVKDLRWIGEKEDETKNREGKEQGRA